LFAFIWPFLTIFQTNCKSPLLSMYHAFFIFFTKRYPIWAKFPHRMCVHQLRASFCVIFMQLSSNIYFGTHAQFGLSLFMPLSHWTVLNKLQLLFGVGII
jgi:hypothetical protein